MGGTEGKGRKDMGRNGKISVGGQVDRKVDLIPLLGNADALDGWIGLVRRDLDFVCEFLDFSRDLDLVLVSLFSPLAMG